MSEPQSHSPLSWRVSPDGNIWAPNASHAIIAKLGENRRPCSEHAANAQLIVTVVNSHARLIRDNAALLDACKAAVEAREKYRAARSAFNESPDDENLETKHAAYVGIFEALDAIKAAIEAASKL